MTVFLGDETDLNITGNVEVTYCTGKYDVDITYTDTELDICKFGPLARVFTIQSSCGETMFCEQTIEFGE